MSTIPTLIIPDRTINSNDYSVSLHHLPIQWVVEN